MLREGNWEARAVCSRPWLKWLLLAVPAVTLLAATALFLTGAITLARVLLVGRIGMGLLFAAPFLPVSIRRKLPVAEWPKQFYL